MIFRGTFSVSGVLPRALGLLAVVAALLLPAAINRHPILFPDSIGYFHAGDAVLKRAMHVLEPEAPHRGRASEGGTAGDLAVRAKDGISTARSVYYGVPLALAYIVGGQWLLPLIQATLAASVILFVLHLWGITSAPMAAAIGIGVALLGGLGVFAVAMMPDVFTGLLLLVLALLLTPAGDDGRVQRPMLASLLFVFCLFHKAHIAIAAAVILVFVLACVATRLPIRWRAAAAPTLAIVLAVVAHAAVGWSVRQITGKPPQEVPFVLARMVGDGTAERYLRAHCPGEGGVLCRYVARMPMTEDEFLWSHDPAHGVWQLASPEEKRRIVAAQGSVMVGVLRIDPLGQAAASFGNFLRQLVVVGVTDFTYPGRLDAAHTPGMAPLLSSYADSPVVRNRPLLQVASALMTAAYLAALAYVAWRLPPLWRRHRDRALTILFVLVGMVANAAVCGVIAGVYPRYQGRVAWLAVMIALALAARPARDRTQAGRRFAHAAA